MTAARRFAQHALETRFEDLPPPAVQAAKTFILDSLGVGIAGASAPGADALLAVARNWGSREEARVWGRSDRVSAPAAAFLNAWQMHNQEYDCLHEGAVVHALASVLPAAPAAAEARGGVSGPALIAAVAVGADIAAGLGLASRAGFRFFRPATAGGFGAVAAAGRILGLDRAALEAAFAWQLAQVSGTMQAHLEGSPILPVQVGFNARAALQSCELSAVGFPPAREVFEGAYGYLALFEGAFDLEPVLRDLGRIWRIAEFSHKPYPAGRATHGGIEGVLALRAAHGFAPDDVADIEVAAPPLILRLVGRPPVANPQASYARLCLAFAAATALRYDAVDISHFRGDALHDPATLALAARIRLRDDGNPDPNALAPQSINVMLINGKRLDWHCQTMLAHPRRPLDRTRQLQKFRRCLQFSAVPLEGFRADQLIASVAQLENIDDVRSLANETAGIPR
ncbi:MAG TPA: MmgE/PrpD family protein [Acetobacteraceae bacterium]|jgi:2-methylcitrate dehydratase PrpD